MQDIEQSLVTFFEKVAKKDKLLLDKLRREQTFSLNQERWCFTLPNLYNYLHQQDTDFFDLDYQQFRKYIFNAPINLSIKLIGAEVIISDNKSKVDNSHYALVWQKAS